MVNKQHFLMQSESGIPKPQTPKENRIKDKGAFFFFCEFRFWVFGAKMNSRA